MSKAATRMYSTWFSTELAGYCERSLTGRGSVKDDFCERSSPDASSSRTIGGCGERGGRFSFRTDTAEGLREVGKEENEGWRWRPEWAEAEAELAAEAGGPPFARCCITSAMMGSNVPAVSDDGR